MSPVTNRMTTTAAKTSTLAQRNALPEDAISTASYH
jgi:hypothetical protein